MTQTQRGCCLCRLPFLHNTYRTCWFNAVAHTILLPHIQSILRLSGLQRPALTPKYGIISITRTPCFGKILALYIPLELLCNLYVTPTSLLKRPLNSRRPPVLRACRSARKLAIALRRVGSFSKQEGLGSRA